MVQWLVSVCVLGGGGHHATYCESLELLQSCALLERYLLPRLSQSGDCTMHQTNSHRKK